MLCIKIAENIMLFLSLKNMSKNISFSAQNMLQIFNPFEIFVIFLRTKPIEGKLYCFHNTFLQKQKICKQKKCSESIKLTPNL